MDQQDRLTKALAHRYTIEREIGSGGMATVYLAQDLKHNRQVAVKVLKPELAESIGPDRFLREIETVANLAHPHILPLHDSGEVDGFLFFVMPFVKGDSLRIRLTKEKQLPIEEATRLTREIASALAYAHEEGVIHRDVKPGNIMLEAGHAVLADFGVAHVMTELSDDRITRTGTSVGTPAYMSPEQVTGERSLDQRSDQYALGCVLYEMLAGQPPFTGPTGDVVVRQHLTAEPPTITAIRPGVPTQVVTTLERALSKTPADRFDTTGQMMDALSPEQILEADRSIPKRRFVRSRLLGSTVALAVVVGVGLFAREFLAGPSYPGSSPLDRPYTVLATVEGSADPAIQETVGFLLRSALDMAHVVQTVPVQEVQRSLTLMERPITEPLDPATAREVAERLGVNTVVSPRVDAVGTGLLLAARVEEVATGHLVAEASIPAADANAVVETVDALSRELRSDLGEARAALANTDPLPQVLTPSLDALRIYREGMGFHFNFQPGLGVPRFREALELDPEFGAAHFSLFAAYHNLGQPDSALASALRALDSPDRLSDVQRRALEAMVKYWSDFASWDVSLFRTGNGVGDALLLTDFQLFDQAWTNIKVVVEEFVRQNRRFDPERRLATDGNPAWRNLVRLAIATGRVPEYSGLLDSLRVEVSEYSALMKNLDSNDWDRADSIRNSAPDIWTTHTNKRTAVAVLDAVRGRIRQSAEHWESFRSFRVSPDRVRLMYKVLYGTPGIDNPVALTDRGLDAVEAYVAHGVREAILGDTVEAKAVRAGMEAARNNATSELFEAAFEPMFALLDAGITMRRGEWIEATGILEPISGRLGEPGYGFISDRFLVRWILAEAYAQLGNMDSSIEELNAVLLERSFDPLFVLVYPPAHFKLGQLHAQVGDSERAMNHFRLFLEVFIDPDQEYAWMVEEAQAELVKLEG